MRIETEDRQDGIQLARTAGELDALGAPILREYLDERIGSAGPFVLDLDNVTFLGSAGLHLLLRASQSADRAQLSWALVGNHHPVARPLQITGLAGHLPMRPSVPEAILSLASPSLVDVR
ncbi:STAS domain-containing protein [Amycolatopsis sp. K13G38]|uniref:Anti-sigma factor antagonist n=1 Tax=Amycolatopsis acididurans TaxID=2724524 RepID=A0ABX1JD37_9PSEU|nr:STAS domain-containing protein [Amycolatopsis acididurans]NKQ57161.1 STAS domain-containing protein [Amycolatopsis acididurans]